MAAVYIAESATGENFLTMLTEAFPEWEKIETHREVVQFACGILVQKNAFLLLNHVCKLLAEYMYRVLDDGDGATECTSILLSCQKESGIFAPNQHFSLYPSCNCPLAEVLANTNLVYIDGIDLNDPLDLCPGSANIFVELRGTSDNWYDRLWQALHKTHANLISLDLCELGSVNATKLHHFSQMKYLSTMQYSEAAMKDLAESIEAWGPQPQLTCIKLFYAPIPRSLMTALVTCKNLLQI